MNRRPFYGNKRIPRFCTVCGCATQSNGKKTSKRCRDCYNRSRAESRARRLAEIRCVDCGVTLTSDAGKRQPKRCKPCQNRRPDLKAQRYERQQATHQAHTDDANLLRNAGRRRAQKLYPTRPCAKCGDPKGVRHHKDRNTFNNVPGNIEYLCQPCHMREHYRLGHINLFGRGAPNPLPASVVGVR